MRSRDELRSGCAQLLKALRLKNGLSKSRMATMLYIDDHTWSKYESGQSSPSVPDFIYLFNQLGEDALAPVLRYLYPEQYTDDESMCRDAFTHYITDICSDQLIREFSYIAYGNHGSNIAPQLNMFTMIDHLPMEYRYAIAQMVDTFWRLAESRGELINTETAMPDIDLFREGLRKGRQAAFERRQSYSTSVLGVEKNDKEKIGGNMD